MGVCVCRCERVHVCMHACMHACLHEHMCLRAYVHTTVNAHTLTQVLNDVVQHRGVDLHVVDVGSADAVADLVATHSAVVGGLPRHFHRRGQRPHPHLSQLRGSHLHDCSPGGEGGGGEEVSV